MKDVIGFGGCFFRLKDFRESKRKKIEKWWSPKRRCITYESFFNVFPCSHVIGIVEIIMLDGLLFCPVHV